MVVRAVWCGDAMRVWLGASVVGVSQTSSGISDVQLVSGSVVECPASGRVHIVEDGRVVVQAGLTLKWGNKVEGVDSLLRQQLSDTDRDVTEPRCSFIR